MTTDHRPNEPNWIGEQVQDWSSKPGDRVVRRPREEQLSPVLITVSPPRARTYSLTSPLFVLYTFFALIVVSTLVLLLPFMHEGSGFTPFMEAFFTAVSAITVTGLVVQETATYWTPVGQIAILGMIFVGGMSFMVTVTFLVALTGKRLNLSQRIQSHGVLHIDQLAGLRRLILTLIILMTGIQFIGFLLLLSRFWFLFPPSEAIFQAAFQAVSGFNNAGFVILPGSESFSSYQLDRIVLSITAILVLLGATSYWVIVDMIRAGNFTLMALNTKLVIIFSVALILSGATFFFLAEYDNESTIGTLELGDKIIVSIFESMSGRTAGFSTVGWGAGQIEQPTKIFFTVLMFIGGASGSVAGGIKINTLAIVLIGLLSTFRGIIRPRAFGREIPKVQIQSALTLLLSGIIVVFLTTLVITFTESQVAFVELFFEVVSALGTAGLTTGLTEEISDLGHLILAAAMFIGRIGPFALFLFLIQRAGVSSYRYAEERVTLG